MNILLEQYLLVCDSRKTLLDYCETISAHDFITSHENFGGRSIRHTLVHVSNVYHFWIGQFTETDSKPTPEAAMFKSVQEVRSLFLEVDALVNTFIDAHADNLFTPITGTVPNRELRLSITPLELFTHVITHEFHHKGQVLTMSRQLGYIPIDTDVIRFE